MRGFKHSLLLSINPNYVRFSLIGGSILLWVYFMQILSGFFLAIFYSSFYDNGLSSIHFFWWEYMDASFVARVHSELGNIFFFMIYSHILIKLWGTAFYGDIDHTWFSGVIILVLAYLTGITGAIMPCSILAEVTATVIGYAINSLSFLNFDFLGSFLIPGLGLTDDTMFRVFLVHALAPVLMFFFIIEHLSSLHYTEYTDEDEMDVLFFARFEYLEDFFVVEVYYWVELLFFFFFLRFICDFFWPSCMTVSYSCSNFEFWPLQEDIDFVLAIPHWYLRPLMSSLVVIPHHYIGFFYVIFFFAGIILLPWISSSFRIYVSRYEYDIFYSKYPIDLSSVNLFFFYLFVLSLTYTSLIVPTGRYFVSLGSNELLVFFFWYIINYIVLHRIIFYIYFNILSYILIFDRRYKNGLQFSCA